MSFNISEKQLAVLRWIAENGSTTEYELTKHLREIGISSFIAHQAPRVLAEKRLLKAEPKGKARTGKTIKQYQLTLKGLFTLVLAEGRQINLNKVIKKWRHLLPLVFEKWDYLVSAGLESELVAAVEWLAMWGAQQGGDVTGIMLMEQLFNYIFHLQTPKIKVKWIKAIRGDKDLRRWAVATMKLWLAESREWIQINEKTLQLMEMAEEPDWQKETANLRWHAQSEEASEEEKALKYQDCL
jgi:hypothetical protein